MKFRVAPRFPLGVRVSKVIVALAQTFVVLFLPLSGAQGRSERGIRSLGCRKWG